MKQLRSHRQRKRLNSASVSVAARATGANKVDFAPWPIPDAGTPRRALRVGVILDDFSALALSYEWNQITIPRESWREILKADDSIDLLFVESAWHGNSGSWQYCLTGPSAPATDLRDLISWCNQTEVPTVFWNKEDPVHFEDFLPTARLFDYVFTTDSNQVKRYKEELGHDRVDVLPFAAQERIHNPSRPRKGFHSRDICFAGMYFAHRHPERRAQMDLLLNAAADVSHRMDHGLEIFSRYLGNDDRYQFPGDLSERVVGSLDYPKMLSAYRAFKVFLNVNTVIDSPTMCARRIFEITASGTPVVTTPSAAISKFFDETMITQVRDREEAGFVLRALVNSPELRAVQTHRAQRNIWQRHTYNHRINHLLSSIGLNGWVTNTLPSVSMLVSTNRPQQLEHVLRTAARQKAVNKQLVLLTHGFTPDSAILADLASELEIEFPTVLYADSDLPLGACLNRLADAADGEFAAKIDDDDFYGEHYLADQAYAAMYSGADVVGKQAHYVRLEAQSLTALHSPEREHRYTDFVPGPTIFSRTETIREVRFPDLFRGEDTGFLQRVGSSGGAVFSGDRFQFVRVRNAVSDGAAAAHTWNISDWHILANSRVAYSGQDTEPVMI